MNSPYTPEGRYAEARSQMWASLLGYEYGSYLCIPQKQKKKMRQEFAKMRGLKPGQLIPQQAQDYLGVCATTGPSLGDMLGVAPPNTTPGAIPKRKGLDYLQVPTRNEDMYVHQDMTVREKTEADARREHFLDRLQQIYRDHSTVIREKFGIDHTSPKTVKELIEWIKADYFTLAEDIDDEDEYDQRYSPLSFITWSKIKRDLSGYKDAEKKLGEMLTSYQDMIWAETEVSKMPKILEKFSKETIH